MDINTGQEQGHDEADGVGEDGESARPSKQLPVTKTLQNSKYAHNFLLILAMSSQSLAIFTMSLH